MKRKKSFFNHLNVNNDIYNFILLKNKNGCLNTGEMKDGKFIFQFNLKGKRLKRKINHEQKINFILRRFLD